MPRIDPCVLDHKVLKTKTRFLAVKQPSHGTPVSSSDVIRQLENYNIPIVSVRSTQERIYLQFPSTQLAQQAAEVELSGPSSSSANSKALRLEPLDTGKPEAYQIVALSQEYNAATEYYFGAFSPLEMRGGLELDEEDMDVDAVAVQESVEAMPAIAQPEAGNDTIVDPANTTIFYTPAQSLTDLAGTDQAAIPPAPITNIPAQPNATGPSNPNSIPAAPVDPVPEEYYLAPPAPQAGAFNEDQALPERARSPSPPGRPFTRSRNRPKPQDARALRHRYNRGENKGVKRGPDQEPAGPSLPAKVRRRN